jgi:DNA polymerase-3 subunit delta
MWLVSSLLNQLVAYKNGARIERRDAEIFLDQKNNDTIFAAIDAVAEGNTRKALLLLASERREGTEEGFIFSMLVRQFKILLQLKDLENREKASPETAAKLLGLPPFVVKKSAGILRRYTLLELTERYRVLAEIDLKMKSGIAPQTLLTDLFVVSLERSIKL